MTDQFFVPAVESVIPGKRNSTRAVISMGPPVKDVEVAWAAALQMLQDDSALKGNNKGHWSPNANAGELTAVVFTNQDTIPVVPERSGRGDLLSHRFVVSPRQPKS